MRPQFQTPKPHSSAYRRHNPSGTGGATLPRLFPRPRQNPDTFNGHNRDPQSLRLSPIARFIVDAIVNNRRRWGAPVVSELKKLRRVTPNLVAEILRVEHDPKVAAKLFHWAGKQKGYKHNYATYNALTYCLNRNQRFREADQVLELMASQRKPPSEKQFEILIRMHSDAGRGLRVFYVYEKMKKFGVKPGMFLYNRIMDALVKTDHLGLAMSVYRDFRDGGLMEGTVTFMILIKGLCKAGRIEEMLELLVRMRSNLCKPDVFAYSAIFRGMISKGDLDGCMMAWEEMKSDRVEPDVMTYVNVITGLCWGKRVQKAFELFKEMKKKRYLVDRSVYCVLIDAFVAEGKIDVACDLFKDLVDSGCRADLGIYNSLIDGLCNGKRVDEAYKLLQDAVEEGLKPGFVTVNPLLVAYSELRRTDDFLELLEQTQGLEFSIVNDLSKFFSSMVRKDKRITVALEVFDLLKEKGYCSISVYNILMEALHRIGEVKRALELFDDLKRSDIEPDSPSYGIAIACFIEDDRIQEACSCYNKILDKSWVPSVSAYRVLAEGLSRNGETDAAMMLVRECLATIENGPMEFKYTLTIIHECKSGNSDKVIGVLDEMLQQGCPPNDVIYSAVIFGMCKHGTLDEARKVFLSLRENKLISDAKLILYDEILSKQMKKKTANLEQSGSKFFGLKSRLK